jgi:hypothetical protein
MRKTPPAKKRVHPHDAVEPRAPLCDADRLPRGLPLESGEPQPEPARVSRLH